MFFVGSFGNDSCVEVLFESESVSRNLEKSGEERNQVARTIATGTNGQRYDYETETLVAETLRVGGRDRGAGDSSDNTPIVASDFTAGYSRNYNDLSPGPFVIAGNQRGEVRETLPNVTASRSAKQFQAVVKTTTLRLGHTKGNERQGGIREEFVGTLEGTRSVNFAISSPIDPDRMREASRIARRVDSTPDGQRYRALGNAVTVRVVQWIAQRIKGIANDYKDFP